MHLPMPLLCEEHVQFIQAGHAKYLSQILRSFRRCKAETPTIADEIADEIAGEIADEIADETGVAASPQLSPDEYAAAEELWQRCGGVVPPLAQLKLRVAQGDFLDVLHRAEISARGAIQV